MVEPGRIDDIEIRSITKQTYLRGVRRRLEILGIPADKEGLPVFGKQIIDKDQIARPPGQDLASGLEVHVVEWAQENVGLAHIEVALLGDQIAVSIALESDVTPVKIRVQVELESILHDRHIFLVLVFPEPVAAPHFIEAMHFHREIGKERLLGIFLRSRSYCC